jgi:hypothetical protein
MSSIVHEAGESLKKVLKSKKTLKSRRLSMYTPYYSISTELFRTEQELI